MPSIAIIGAGCSGLAAAHTLQDAGYTVTLFEKNDDVGGRATTGKRDGFIYDYGAQYIKGGSPVSEHLVTERFRCEDLIDIGKPVWIFDGQGRIQEGDPVQNADPKWTYRNGLVTFARKMAEGLDVRFGVHVARIVQLITMDELSEPEFYMSSWPRTNLGGRYFQLRTSGWSFAAAREYPQEVFDQLLITLPASQAIELIDANLVSYDLREVILSILLRVRYNPLLSVMLGYETRPSSRPYYALVNTDKAHPISWLAWEHEKSAERVPRGAGLQIAQRYGRPLVRDVDLGVHSMFDPLNRTDRFGEVCMVVRRPDGKLLTMKKTLYPPGAYRLLTGGINHGERVLDALLRETYEET